MNVHIEYGKTALLFVEDDVSMLSLVQMALEPTGYSVLPASTGQEALEQYAACHSDIRLAVVDLVLPDIQGAALIRRLLAIDDDISVVVATGLGAEEAQEALRAGALGVIRKPYTLSRLHSELDRFVPATVPD